MLDTTTRSSTPLFALGRVVATPGALDALRPHPSLLHAILARHATGDWGAVDAHDRKANDDAVKHGGRVFSAYVLPSGETAWVITEADRSSTCVLLPEEY